MIIQFSNKKIKIKFTGKSVTYHSGTLAGMRRETFYKFGKKHGKSAFYNKYPNFIVSITPYKDGKTAADSTVGIHYIYENDKKIKTLKQDVELFIREFF
ncbi:hypothetical protein [Fusobacterium ulcerans]|uniref:hypothetical protein n=1 Tax=Fusobacterium ulcerans TaxID=861 RepID=UPI0026F1A349|nr:hypothetical protein [Fusobacterium ulcerans]